MSEPASTPGPREVWERLHRGLRDRDYDMDAQADLYAADGVLEWPFAPPGVPRRIQGREEIRRALAPLGEQVRRAGHRITGYSSVVVHETTDPEVIVAEFDLDGEVAATGEAYRLSYIQVLRVRDGEIVSFRDYWNPLAMPVVGESFDASSEAAPAGPKAASPEPLEPAPLKNV